MHERSPPRRGLSKLQCQRKELKGRVDMDRQGKLLIAVEADALGRIEADLAEIKALLQRVTINPAPDWVGVSAAAQMLGCSASTVRRMVDRGDLEAKGAGKARRVKVK